MPTGYTSMLDDNPKMTTQQWIMEGLARAFGVCVSLKEDAWGLTAEQVKKRIVENSSISYHEKELAVAKAEVAKLSAWTDEVWMKAYVASEKEKIKHNADSKRRKTKMRKRHEKAISDLQRVINSDVSQFTKDVAKFGLEQLKMVEHETEPYIIMPVTLNQYKFETLASAKREIVYHTKELAEEKQRVKERLEYYEQLQKDVSKILVPELISEPAGTENDKPNEVKNS